MEPEASLGALLDDAEVVAKLYRRLNLLFGLQFLLGVLHRALSMKTYPVWASLVLLGISIAFSLNAYKLAERIGAGIPILWAIAMFIPFANLVAYVLLDTKGGTWFKRYGIKTGFLGPSRESIEEVRRRAVTSTFE